MKISEIIEVLKTMPQDQELFYMYDLSISRLPVGGVWKSKEGRVIMGHAEEMIAEEKDCPDHIPFEDGKGMDDYRTNLISAGEL